MLVTGATGLLGRQVMIIFPADHWEVRGLCYSRSRPGLTKCDLTSEADTAAQISEFQPQVVVHCAAERRPDVVQRDPAQARKLNVDAAGVLALACEQAGAWMIFLSTDYVFDGSMPPYDVDAPTNPLNSYGLHKVEAERLVLRVPTHSVLRVPLLYGPVEFLAESSVMDLYAGLLEGRLTKADHRQKRYPTSACDVACVIRAMVESHLAGKQLVGTYHWQSHECLTKFDMAAAIAAVTGQDFSAVQPDTVVPAAPRPEDSRLDCSRIEQQLAGSLNFARTPFAEGMRMHLSPFMVSFEFKKALGEAQGTMPKQDLARMLCQLLPELSPKRIDDALAMVNVEGQEEIRYQDFVRWVFH